VLGGVFLAAIALYKSRPRQVRVVRSAWLVVLALGVLQFIAGNSLHAYLEKSGTVESSYGVSFFLPFLAIVFAFLAERAIKKDEDLVKSMDRLR
jgi:drug/metabolite transporter (DMT)-like permease